MSGHSKWATTKRAKAVTDAKRGAIFTKLANIITIAAKEKSGDLDTNFSLRMAVEKAKTANMPKDNIEKAIKRGTGELEGGQIEELYYEGIGPANSQFIVKALTDNKNRSAAEIRHLFTKYGGSLGTVMWNFDKKGVIRISDLKFSPAKRAQEISDLELDLIEVGAQDIIEEDEGITIITEIPDLQNVNKFLEDKEIKSESAEIEFIAKDEAEVDEDTKEKLEKFIEALEENEDISDYYTNINI
jgi:YebC/PmpR family DNA-binding regulatory protein